MCAPHARRDLPVAQETLVRLEESAGVQQSKTRNVRCSYPIRMERESEIVTMIRAPSAANACHAGSGRTSYKNCSVKTDVSGVIRSRDHPTRPFGGSPSFPSHTGHISSDSLGLISPRKCLSVTAAPVRASSRRRSAAFLTSNSPWVAERRSLGRELTTHRCIAGPRRSDHRMAPRRQ
jgi:hypothetical protein